MIIKQIKISEAAKDKLAKLKGKTGIKNWNVLCRWAFCYSLSENSVPADIPIKTDSNVEMSWFTFAGEHSELYEALIIAWCKEHDFPIDDETISKYFKLHLERGIAHLAATNLIKNLNDLIALGVR